MKPHQGLFVLLLGVVIAMLAMAPLSLALIQSDAPPDMVDTWAIGTIMLYFGIGWLLFGLVVVVIGLFLTCVGVFTK